MVNVTFTECVRPKPVPVMVILRVCLSTLVDVSTVSTDVPAFTIDGGSNTWVERGGAPLTDSLTVPVNSAPAVIVTVYWRCLRA